MWFYRIVPKTALFIIKWADGLKFKFAYRILSPIYYFQTITTIIDSLIDSLDDYHPQT